MRKKSIAVLLSIFLGGIGAQKFYLGQTKKGIVYLLFFWTYIPFILSVIEGIRILFMSDSEFNGKYNKDINTHISNEIENMRSKMQQRIERLEKQVQANNSTKVQSESSQVQEIKKTQTLKNNNFVRKENQESAKLTLEIEEERRRKKEEEKREKEKERQQEEKEHERELERERKRKEREEERERQKREKEEAKEREKQYNRTPQFANLNKNGYVEIRSGNGNLCSSSIGHGRAIACAMNADKTLVAIVRRNGIDNVVEIYKTNGSYVRSVGKNDAVNVSWSGNYIVIERNNGKRPEVYKENGSYVKML